MFNSSDDASLIDDCLNGNQQAWHAFVDRFSKLIYYSINKVTSPYGSNFDHDDIEDIYHGVFLSFMENDYKKLRQFEGKDGCTLSSWIRLISIRYTIDFLRKNKQHISIDIESDNNRPMVEKIQDNKPSAHDFMEMSETEKMIKLAIQELPPSDMLFVELYYIKELQPEEIAQIMNVTVSTVYSKKNRIKEKLEKILKLKGFLA